MTYNKYLYLHIHMKLTETNNVTHHNTSNIMIKTTQYQSCFSNNFGAKPLVSGSAIICSVELSDLASIIL